MKMRDALATVTPERVRRIAHALRFDSWRNEVTGFGTSRDKTTYTEHYGANRLADQQLANLYEGDDIAARCVDIVPNEMLREGFSVDVGDPAKNTELADALEGLGARGKLADAIRWGRLYGGGALLIGADDGRPSATPLVAERAKGVSYLYVLDRTLLWPLTWYTQAGHPKLGLPETYLVSPSLQAQQNYATVHESRLLLFGGATTTIRQRERNNGWDDSILQRIVDVLRTFNTGFKAVEILLTDANQAVFKMQGLAEAIAANGQEVMQQRLQVMDLCRSVLRAIVVDAGDPNLQAGAEDFQRHSVSFDSIPQVLDKFMLRVAATAETPVTLLFGQSPAGMNATGESDFRWFYDRIRSKNTLELAPQIRRLVRVMLATKDFASKEGAEFIKVKFPPLWTEPPSVEATRRKTVAEADAVYINAGVVTPEEVALHRLRPDGFVEELVLSDEGKSARESSLQDELERLENGEPELPEPAIPGVPFREGGEETDERADSGDILTTLGNAQARRIIIGGGPRSGKTTLAARASERFQLPLKGTDSLVESSTWGDDSERVAAWFDEVGDFVVEGTTVPRALRKWLRANPEKRLNATVVWINAPKAARNKGQAAMAKAVRDVWTEVKPELERRQIPFIEG